MPDQPIVDTPENWDAASHGYAQKVAPMMMAKFAEEFVDRLDVNQDTYALEVAAGSGALTIELARNTGSLLATDFSPKMIELLMNTVKEEGLSNVSFALMDGQDLELEDNSFDRAASSFGVMLFPNRLKGFNELKRVVRPGGKVLVSGWAGPDKFRALGIFMEAIERAFPDLPATPQTPPVFTLSDLDFFRSEMEMIGFKNIEVGYSERTSTINNLDEFWAMLTVGAPPAKLLFDRVGEDGKTRVYDSLGEIIYERYGNDPIVISNTASVGVGVVG